jgi:hypothetical protein
MIHADRPEEAQARCEFVNIQARVDARSNIFQPIGKRVAKFDIGGRTRLLHVIAANRDAVELRHVRRAIPEDLADDPHRGARRIDVRVPDHELFQNVVLNGSTQFLRSNALLLARDDVERHDRQDGSVHGHRNRHLVQRDLAEEDLHIFYGVNGHACFTDVSEYSLVV